MLPTAFMLAFLFFLGCSVRPIPKLGIRTRYHACAGMFVSVFAMLLAVGPHAEESVAARSVSHSEVRAVALQRAAASDGETIVAGTQDAKASDLAARESEIEKALAKSRRMRESMVPCREAVSEALSPAEVDFGWMDFEYGEFEGRRAKHNGRGTVSGGRIRFGCTFEISADGRLVLTELDL